MYYNEAEARKQVVEAGRRLLMKEPAALIWGSISARTDEDSFVITPELRGNELPCEEDLAVVNINDCSYEGNLRPGSGKGIHIDAYALRPDVNFIIHSHQYYASVVAAECRSISSAPCGEYGLPGTGMIRKNMKACMEENPSAKKYLMARHGALLLGGSSDEALGLAAELEDECRKLVEQRVQISGVISGHEFDADKISINALPYVVIARDPYIMECCRAGAAVCPYIDAFAKMIGPDVQIVDCDEWAAERALLGYTVSPVAKGLAKMPMTGALDRMGGQQPALNALIGRNAVLVREVGAVCAGRTEDEAKTAAMIVSMNCAAACYARDTKPMNVFDARLQRYLYLMKK